MPGNGAVTELPLVIDSEQPLRRIGLTVVAHDGAEPILATSTVTAFDQYGRLLGSASQEGIGTLNFMGLEAIGAEGISRVSIKCDRGVEGIEDLIVDYASPRVFTTYLPQVADGKGLRSSITFLNLSDSTANGVIKFFTQDGEGQDLGGLSQTTPVTIPWRGPGTQTIITSGGPDLKSGYATVTSDCPLQVQVVFRIKDASGIERNVGVVAAPPLYRNSGAVFKEVASGIDTAIALVNPTDEACTARIYLASEEPRFYQVPSLQIPPRARVSKFIAELAPDFEGKDLQGSIEVLCGTPLAMILVRTVNGFATSSSPSGGN